MNLINSDTMISTMEVMEGPAMVVEADSAEVSAFDIESSPVTKVGEEALDAAVIDETGEGITGDGPEYGENEVYNGDDAALTEGIYGGSPDYVGGYNGDDSGFTGDIGGYADEGMDGMYNDMGDMYNGMDGMYEGMDGMDGMYEGMDGINTETGTEFHPMSNGLFVYGIAGLSLLLGVGFGILCALLKAKKGLKPYED